MVVLNERAVTMHIYYLTPAGEKVMRILDNQWGGSSKVTVRAGDYYAAREKALTHALENGHNAMIVCNSCQLLARDRNPPRTALTPLGEFGEHGLLLYVCRLFNRFAHVYVPPVSALAGIPLSGVDCTPTIPMVAAYRVDALVHVDLSKSFGQDLCAKGYDSYTLGDYFYQDIAGKPQLDEYGSTSTWRKKYAQALATLVS
jgi:hypothetical protein